jgi:hypothetical protein
MAKSSGRLVLEPHRTWFQRTLVVVLLVKLLLSEPSTVVLRPKHWRLAARELITGLHQISGADLADVPQPLAVHSAQGGHAGDEMS